MNQNYIDVWSVSNTLPTRTHSFEIQSHPMCIECLNLTDNMQDNLIAVGLTDSSIGIFSTQGNTICRLGGTKESEINNPPSLVLRKGSHAGSVLDLARNTHNSILASAGADSVVKVWDLSRFKIKSSLLHHRKEVTAVSWNPRNEHRLLSGSLDKTVVMADIRLHQENAPVVHFSFGVKCLAWDPFDDNKFMVNLEDGKVFVYDIRSWESYAFGGDVCAFSYNPSIANCVATGSLDGTVKVWNISNNQPKRLLSSENHSLCQGEVASISFSKHHPYMLAYCGYERELQLVQIKSEASH